MDKVFNFSSVEELDIDKNKIVEIEKVAIKREFRGLGYVREMIIFFTKYAFDNNVDYVIYR